MRPQANTSGLQVLRAVLDEAERSWCFNSSGATQRVAPRMLSQVSEGWL